MTRSLSLPRGRAWRSLPYLSISALLLISLSGCAMSLRSPDRGPAERVLASEQGVASWYEESQMTASGGWFNPEAMTAAHKTLPFGSIVRVTRLDTRESVVVQINDRGPFVEGRVIDLARKPARKLGMLAKGIAPCRVEVLSGPGGNVS